MVKYTSEERTNTYSTLLGDVRLLFGVVSMLPSTGYALYFVFLGGDDSVVIYFGKIRGHPSLDKSNASSERREGFEPDRVARLISTFEYTEHMSTVAGKKSIEPKCRVGVGLTYVYIESSVLDQRAHEFLGIFNRIADTQRVNRVAPRTETIAAVRWQLRVLTH